MLYFAASFVVWILCGPIPLDQWLWHPITVTSLWARWRLKSPASRLFAEPFFHRSKKTSKLCITGPCGGNPSVTCEFPLQRASNAEKFPFDDVIMGVVHDWVSLGTGSTTGNSSVCSKKTPNPRITGPLAELFSTVGFSSWKASNMENASMPWRQHTSPSVWQELWMHRYVAWDHDSWINRRDSQMRILLAACRETAGHYNKLPEVLTTLW